MSVNHEAAFEYAKKILPMMAKYSVLPVPENYAVWYSYVAGNNANLKHEIDTLIKEDMAFTADINAYLYTKFVTESDTAIVKEATDGVRKLVKELLDSIEHFSGDTKSYKSILSERMQDIQTSNGQVDQIVSSVVEQITGMMSSSDVINAQLDTSRKEIEELKSNLAKVTTESEKDFLTGVYNRKALDMKLGATIESCLAIKAPLCMLMIDIDHFKTFNDRYGHLVGDEVVKIVARSLMDMVKGKDIVARYGGEEFCVLLPDTPMGGAVVVAENIRKSIAKKELKRKDTGENYGQITVSIGVALHRPTDTIPTFLKRADEAMYDAKKTGRNCVRQYTD